MSDLLTVDEVAKILRLTPYTVRVKLRSGEIKGVKVGSEWRVSRASLNRYTGAGKFEEYEREKARIWEESSSMDDYDRRMSALITRLGI